MKMNKKLDIGLFKKILKMETFELYDFMEKELSKYYAEVHTNWHNRNFLHCVGDQPVMLVAHLDTVFDIHLQGNFNTFGYGDFYSYSAFEEKQVYHDREEGILWSPQGLGADDRAGVFMILSLVQQGLRPHIVLTTDEEIGSASGADFARINKYYSHKYKLNYIIELDRAGSNDAVFYNCDNPSFNKYIESYGFKTAVGSFSDISIICPVLGIAGVNLSVGYEREHTEAETINLFTMSKNFDIIYIMVEKSKKIKEPFIYIPKPKVKPKNRKSTLQFQDIVQQENYDTVIRPSSEPENCSKCGKEVVEYLYAPHVGKVCLNCYMKLYA